MSSSLDDRLSTDLLSSLPSTSLLHAYTEELRYAQQPHDHLLKDLSTGVKEWWYSLYHPTRLTCNSVNLFTALETSKVLRNLLQVYQRYIDVVKHSLAFHQMVSDQLNDLEGLSYCPSTILTQVLYQTELLRHSRQEYTEALYETTEWLVDHNKAFLGQSWLQQVLSLQTFEDEQMETVARVRSLQQKHNKSLLRYVDCFANYMFCFFSLVNVQLLWYGYLICCTLPLQWLLSSTVSYVFVCFVCCFYVGSVVHKRLATVIDAHVPYQKIITFLIPVLGVTLLLGILLMNLTWTWNDLWMLAVSLLSEPVALFVALTTILEMTTEKFGLFGRYVCLLIAVMPSSTVFSTASFNSPTVFNDLTDLVGHVGSFMTLLSSVEHTSDWFKSLSVGPKPMIEPYPVKMLLESSATFESRVALYNYRYDLYEHSLKDWNSYNVWTLSNLLKLLLNSYGYVKEFETNNKIISALLKPFQELPLALCVRYFVIPLALLVATKIWKTLRAMFEVLRITWEVCFKKQILRSEIAEMTDCFNEYSKLPTGLKLMFRPKLTGYLQERRCHPPLQHL